MEISDLVPSGSVSVEGVFVGPVSPIKTSRNNTKLKCFEGQPKLRSQVEQAREGLRGVSLANCTVKRSRRVRGVGVESNKDSEFTKEV